MKLILAILLEPFEENAVYYQFCFETNLLSGGAGAVTGYTISYSNAAEFGLNFTTNLTASQTNFSVSLISDDGLARYLQYPADQNSGFSGMPIITFRIHYANAVSQAITNLSPFDPACFANGAIMRGSGGSLYLALSAAPPNVTAIRLFVAGSFMPYPINYYNLFLANIYAVFSPGISGTTNSAWPVPYLDIPIARFTNGIYQLPPEQVPLFGAFCLNLAGMGANGNLGPILVASQTANDWGHASVGDDLGFNSVNIPFVDGRTQIAQNISLLLRGAGVEPFNLELANSDYIPLYTVQEYSNYVYSAYAWVGADYYFTNNYEILDYSTNLLQRNEFEPFEENTLMTNVLFNTNLFDGYGGLANQLYSGSIEIDEIGDMLLTNAGVFDAFNYVTANTNLPVAPIGAVLAAPTSQWILSLDYFETSVLQANPDGSFTLPAGAINGYGLPYQGVEYYDASDASFHTVGLGGTFSPSGYEDDGTYLDYFFQKVADPVLGTSGYYFARPRMDPVPGQAAFSITNATLASMITPFGRPFSLTAWAKQSVSNGYANVFAYPQQYFDQAYLADSNGNITTNQTGILSEYGDFFPVQPGKVFLTTLPDGATGSTGTNVVNVIKLQVDANRDGTMDTSFTGPDNTYIYQPYVLWVNNDFDRNDGSGTNQDDFRTASNPGGLL